MVDLASRCEDDYQYGQLDVDHIRVQSFRDTKNQIAEIKSASYYASSTTVSKASSSSSVSHQMSLVDIDAVA